MKISSILKKVKKLLIFKTISGEWKYDNVFLHSVDSEPIRRIILYFNDPEFMHLGDHLFFEPLASELTNQGYKVVVMATNQMKPYFDSLGYCTELSSSEKLTSFDLIITKLEFSDFLKNINCNCLYISTSYSSSCNYLCQDIIEKTSKVLGYSNTNQPSIPSKAVTASEKIKLPNKYNYVVFNNYVDSASYRLTTRDYNHLEEFVINLAKKEDLKIIHLGTKAEKKRDKKKYKFVFADIRGQTEMLDIFSLAENPNVKYCVSFDVFVAHVFFINNKKSFVKFRGRFTKKRREYITNYVLPPFEATGKKIDLVEFV
jgi:hypothetical protein